MLDLLELKITIRKQGGEYTAVTEQSNGETICTNTFQYDSTHLMLLGSPDSPDQKASISHFVQRITRRRHRSPYETLVAQYGEELYQYLFGNGREFRDFLRAHKEHNVIHLKLVLTANTAVLSGLPWEYLYDGKVFLCQSKNIQIIRQTENLSAAVSAPSSAPLRVLALISSPEDQAPLNMDDELARLQDALAVVITGGKVELDVLPEVTTFTLRRALHDKFYHVLYFVGYGKFQLMQQRSYLCFEDDVGHSDWIGAPQLKKILLRHEPQLLILNGRTNVQTGVRDPYHSFALECLQQGLAAALTIPTAMHPDSTEILTQVFFNALGSGQTVCESMRAVRRAMIDLDEALGDEKRFDWGTPACYIGTECVQPISATEPTPVLESEEGFEGEGQSAPTYIGRKKELQILRKFLKEKIPVIYVWGHIGAGKSTLIDQLLDHTGVQLKGVLRVQCDAILEPLSVLSKIASFWAGHDPVEHQQAADLLLDSRQDAFVRAQAAQQHLGQYRYLLIFENIDVWFSEPSAESSSEVTGSIAYPLIRSLLLGLLHAKANTTFLFTGARRWADLSTLPSTDRCEIPLPLLKPIWAYQLMSSLPGLNTISRQTKEAVYWHLGGHPLAIKLLSAWRFSDQDNDLDNLFKDPPVSNRSTTAWIAYLLKDIIDHLDPGEAQQLPIAAVLNRPISAKVLPNLTQITSPYAGVLLNTWWNLGLIQKTEVEGQYKFHQLVRNFILDRISTDEFRRLHLLAAEYYGAPFMDEARRQIYARNAGYQSEERVTWLARDINGILGTWLRQEQDTERYQELLELAMSWHYHLFHAGQFEAAVQIARAIVSVLHRIGLRDLAGALLQRAVSAAEGYDRAVGMDDFAKIQIADGHLASALNVYEEVYKALLTYGTELQCAHVLARSARVQQQLELWDDAIKRYEQALQIMRREVDLRGQVACMYQLSIIYRRQHNLQQALVYSQAAKELYDKLIDDRGLASAAHEQGYILRDMELLDGALENFAESMRLCRRLGDLACTAGNLYEIGDVLHKLGKTEMAIRTLEEAQGLYEMLAAPERVDVLRLLEELYEKQQRMVDAVQRFKAAKHNTVKE